MNLRGVLSGVILVIIFSLLSAIKADALVLDLESLNMDFRFNNPGARANAMGGAFIGLADDATAAYTNPAGLSILTDPELSVEYKYGDYTNRVSLFEDQDFDDTASGVSYASYVHPAEKATFAFFRHKLINLKSDYTFDAVDLDFTTDTDLEAVTTGLAMSHNISSSLRFGVAVGFSELTYSYVMKRYDAGTFIEPHDYHMLVSDEDKAEHYSVSLLWNPYADLNIGLVYRQGPEFDTEKTEWEYDSAEEDYDNVYLYENTLKVPDIYGLGISYRFFSSLTIAVDVNYIEYSDLLENFQLRDDADSVSNYDIDDTAEVHVGLEYIFDVHNMPLAVRCGYFSKPQHRLEYKGDEEDIAQQVKEGDDDDIFSIGFGAVLSDNIQLDVAASQGDFVDEYSVSFVYRLE